MRLVEIFPNLFENVSKKAGVNGSLAIFGRVWYKIFL